MSDALSSQSVPGPRNSIVSVAFVSLAEGTSRARYLLHVVRRCELGRGEHGPFVVQTHADGPSSPLCFKIATEIARQPALDRDSILRHAAGAGNVLGGGDLQASFAADRARAVALVHARLVAPVGYQGFSRKSVSLR